MTTGRATQVPTGEPGRRSDLLADLIAASALGDERAFRRLYRATSDALFGLALRMLKRRDWAEEVLQESFVSVWRHAARYDETKGAAMTWMIRIVRNQALDWIHPSRPDGFERIHARAVDVLGDDLLDGTGNLTAADVAELVEYSRRAERIAACLEALDARQRQSVVLVFFHGLSHGDLARHLQQPLGTVKAWVRRGLARLASCLAGNT
ncbi:MAG TPA: sigma-70 family RNA polymerase sigma factor [Albitalea sp.]